MTGGFFALLDDISMLLDDAATTANTAAQKTAPLLGDDLAVNAEKASGYSASRELPVLWKITKGSFKNKLILLPLAILVTAFAPWIIPIALILGGIYLAYEGIEVAHHYIVSKVYRLKEEHKTTKNITEDEKVKSAIRLDFILSIEIIIVALSSVVDQPLTIQIISVAFVAILATIGVYGFVALIVRLDDTGYWIISKSNGNQPLLGLGMALVASLPKVIKTLSVVGNIAMFLVAGGIFLHYIPHLHELYETYVEYFVHYDFIFNFVLGVAVGYVVMYLERLAHYIAYKK